MPDLFLIHRVDLLLVVLVEDATADLKRVGQFAFLHGQMVGQQREALDLFVVCQLLLEGIDALLHHIHDAWISTKLLAIDEDDAVFLGILF